MTRSLQIWSTALLVLLAGILTASTASAQTRLDKRHRNRSYFELGLGMGIGAGATPAFEPSAGWLLNPELGFNLSRELGLTLGATFGQHMEYGGETRTNFSLHADAEIMPRPAKVEPYGIFGAAVVSTQYPGYQWVMPALRVGAGVDFWTGNGRFSRGKDWYSVPVLGFRAIYQPAFGRTDGPIPIQHEATVELTLKFHLAANGNILM